MPRRSLILRYRLLFWLICFQSLKVWSLTCFWVTMSQHTMILLFHLRWAVGQLFISSTQHGIDWSTKVKSCLTLVLFLVDLTLDLILNSSVNRVYRIERIVARFRGTATRSVLFSKLNFFFILLLSTFAFALALAYFLWLCYCFISRRELSIVVFRF